jgi:hypothetical protein
LDIGHEQLGLGRIEDRARGNWSGWAGHGAVSHWLFRVWFVMVEIEKVSVEIADGELTQAPGFFLQGIHDVCAGRLQFPIPGVDIFGEDPVNGGLEWGLAPAKKYYRLIAGDGADFFAGVEPANRKAEGVAVMLLGALDIRDWQLRHRLAYRV